MQNLSTAEDRIKNAGDRVSQAVTVFTNEYGNIKPERAAQLIGVSRRHLYNLAKDGGVVFRRGLKPVLQRDLNSSDAA